MNDPTKNSKKELREFSRVSVGMRVQVTSGKQAIFSPHLKNVSMSGVFLISPEKLPAGSECQVAIFLEARENQERIEARGRVVRITDEGMAIHFEEIIGPESYHHLRNLVLYNAPNAEKVEKEIESHIGIKPKKS
jgi:hypothetical protein